MSSAKYEAPEFLEVTRGDSTAFVSFEEVVANPQLCAQVVARALAEADAWVRSFGAFFERIGEVEGLKIVEIIELVNSQLSGGDDGESGMYIADE